MNRLHKLQALLNNNSLIVSDPTSIFYLTQHRFDVGERMLALVLRPENEPVLVINKLFPIPSDIKTIIYEDSQDPTQILKNLINTPEIYIDGNFAARFLIPLLDSNKTFKDGSFLVESLRRIKDLDEIKTLNVASEHNDRIMEEMTQHFKLGITEQELTDIVIKKQSSAPLSGVSFDPIVLFTENIADPHGVPSDRKLKENDVILIDMGGIYKNYCSDMTRAFFFGENPELEEIYNVVLQANLNAIAAVKPGIPLSDVDKAARDTIENAGYGDYFIHRTGHGIGLDCHENLDVSSTNNTIIEEGMCFSIEPGIYIEGVGGIRIEDLVAVTKDGAHIFNKHSKKLQRFK